MTTSAGAVSSFSSIQNSINNETSGKASSTSTSSTQGTTASLDSLGSNFTDFISLLTTQLKNQDPTSPVDTTAFTQQLIGFSQVQQQVDTNTNLQSLITSQQNSAVNTSVSYINQLVDANTDTFNLKSGKPMPLLNVTLPEDSNAVTINIEDSTGKVIKTYTGTGTKGANPINWDATDSTGATVPDGDYKLVVSANDNTGNAISGITTDVTDYVSSVGLANGVSTLYFGDIPISTSNIISVKGYYSQATLPANTGNGSSSTDNSSSSSNSTSNSDSSTPPTS